MDDNRICNLARLVNEMSNNNYENICIDIDDDFETVRIKKSFSLIVSLNICAPRTQEVHCHDLP